MYTVAVVCFLEGAPTHMQCPHMIACNHNKMAVGLGSFQAMNRMRLECEYFIFTFPCSNCLEYGWFSSFRQQK